MEPEVKEEGLNIEEASAGIAADLFGNDDRPDAIETDHVDEPVTETPVVEATRPAPRSWAKETHEDWGKIPPKAQEYIELREKQMLDGIEQYKEYNGFGKAMTQAITPYMATIQAQGLDPVKATISLYNAHHRLTQGSPEQRMAAYQELGANLGLVQRGQQQAIDPNVKAAQDRLDRIEGMLIQEQRRQFEQVRVKTSNDVKSFAEAKDEKGSLLHPHFDEVAEDIIVYINAGFSLEDAHAKAVYANPVTREKELARLKTETEAQLKAKSRQEAEAARKASGANVRSRDTRRTPTETLGKMEDTMKATLADIKSRTH